MSLENSIGLFGGTFNPLHDAHLLVARKALQQFLLGKVVFVPSGIPPHKEVENGVSKEDRYEMVRQAILSCSQLSISRVEIDREGPSYTIDTIRLLKETYSERLCFIVGADLLLQIETWKEPEALLQSVPFIIAPRHGINREAFASAPFDLAELWFLNMDEVDLSSTWVREQVKCGKPIDRWVPREVTAYIEQHKLYRKLHLTKTS